MTRNALPILFAALALLASCTTQKRLTRLDREVAGLLDEAQAKHFGADAVPERLSIDGYAPFPAPEDPASAVQLNLRRALELAARHNRDY